MIQKDKVVRNMALAMSSSVRFSSKSPDKIRLWLLALFVSISAICSQWDEPRPETHWTTVDFIRSYGYPAETHTVITSDGYLIEIHRIPHGKGWNGTRGPPVVFQHGFVCTSVIWVLQGPKKDLVFYLADQGYDVWLLNVRGSSYTRLHPSATIAFNDFSFHEMGVHDLPASINYILQETHQKNVTFIGHSMGTTLAFAGLSTTPEINSKLNLLVALGPMTSRGPYTEFTHHLFEKIFNICKYLNIGDSVDNSFIFYKTSFKTWILSLIPSFLWVPVGKMFLVRIGGYETRCNLQVPIELLATHFPDATTQHTFSHYHNNIVKGKFLMRDFGPERNQKTYNSTSPPEYNLSNIKVPISAYVAEADVVTPLQDFLNYVPKFGSNVTIKTFPHFNHFDLIWSYEAVTAVFPHILNDIRSTMAGLYQMESD